MIRKQNFYPRSPCGERPRKSLPMCSSRHFYPRSPCGERLGRYNNARCMNIFLSTLSLRRATRNSQNINREHKISIHALLAESDPPGIVSRNGETLFLSTLSLRRATLHDWPPIREIIISIHALLAESDRTKRRGNVLKPYFYPRSPCGERRGWTLNINGPMKFLSTLSLRRAT